MNWHSRYTQQAKWTRNLRAYIFDKINLSQTQSILEVGCGTGAILSKLPTHMVLHGLDIDPAVLAECQTQTPSSSLLRGNALQLPYSDKSFDVVYCHFLLLWVSDPLYALLEMKRVTRKYIIAFAEPDYTSRIDKPDELVQLGKWQTDALRRQGADPGFGARLAESFFQAGIKLIETGTIQSAGNEASLEDCDLEWAVIESDLAGVVSREDIQKMKMIDKAAREHGDRTLHVPTHFAWGHN